MPETKIISGVKSGYRMYLDHRVGVKFLDLPRADIHNGIVATSPWLPLLEGAGLLDPSLVSLRPLEPSQRGGSQWWTSPRVSFGTESLLWGEEVALLFRMTSLDTPRVQQSPGSPAALRQ